jgi:hypothetical protein
LDGEIGETEAWVREANPSLFIAVLRFDWAVAGRLGPGKIATVLPSPTLLPAAEVCSVECAELKLEGNPD